MGCRVARACAPPPLSSPGCLTRRAAQTGDDCRAVGRALVARLLAGGAQPQLQVAAPPRLLALGVLGSPRVPGALRPCGMAPLHAPLQLAGARVDCRRACGLLAAVRHVVQRALREAGLLDKFAMVLGDEDFGMDPFRQKGCVVRDRMMPELGLAARGAHPCSLLRRVLLLRPQLLPCARANARGLCDLRAPECRCLKGGGFAVCRRR